MILIQIIKLCLFFALIQSKYIQVLSDTISHTSDVNVEVTKEKWICDQIECPLDADRCVITKSNQKDSSVIVRTNICYSKDNKKIEEKTTTSKTEDDHLIDMEMISYPDGTIQISGIGSFDEQEFDVEFEDDIGEGADDSFEDFANNQGASNDEGPDDDEYSV